MEKTWSILLIFRHLRLFIEEEGIGERKKTAERRFALLSEAPPKACEVS